MIFSDSEVRKRSAWPLCNGGVRIAPLDDTQVEPNSYDLTLGREVLLYRDDMVRVCDQEPCRVDLSEDDFELRPGDFALATTRECVTLGNGVAARVAGKSSRAREGLSIEFAGFVDAGFSGEITLELVCHRPFLLTYGMKIGQIVFFDSYPSTHTYDVRGHYQGQAGPTESWEARP